MILILILACFLFDFFLLFQNSMCNEVCVCLSECVSVCV